MRKISANYIFTIAGKPLKNGILFINDSGTIIDVIDTKGDLKESENLEHYNGILVPGFINTHCHLELSHLKNKIPAKIGLPDFILHVTGKREASEDKINTALFNADFLMKVNGIVAVGDISNQDHSFLLKSKSKIKYHTFIEVIGPDPLKASVQFFQASSLYEKAKNQYSINCSIAPHAPYSVSAPLLKDIAAHVSQNNGILSIHNQETDAENQLFSEKKGTLYKTLKSIGVDYSSWNTTGQNSLPSIIHLLPKSTPVILVHNTYTRQEDVRVTKKFFAPGNLFWALCPNSNLYIENKLPDISLLISENQTITIGTDSYASNYFLSVLEELKTISLRYPEISLGSILQWATINGAKALKLETLLGSFEKGKTPGVNLVTGIDFKNMKLTPESTVKVIV